MVLNRPDTRRMSIEVKSATVKKMTFAVIEEPIVWQPNYSLVIKIDIVRPIAKARTIYGVVCILIFPPLHYSTGLPKTRLPLVWCYLRRLCTWTNVILVNARIQENSRDAGSVIPGLIRDRHDKYFLFHCPFNIKAWSSGSVFFTCSSYPSSCFPGL